MPDSDDLSGSAKPLLIDIGRRSIGPFVIDSYLRLDSHNHCIRSAHLRNGEGISIMPFDQVLIDLVVLDGADGSFQLRVVQASASVESGAYLLGRPMAEVTVNEIEDEANRLGQGRPRRLDDTWYFQSFSTVPTTTGGIDLFAFNIIVRYTDYSWRTIDDSEFKRLITAIVGNR